MIFMTIWLVASAYLHLVFSANQSVKPQSPPTLSCTVSGGSRNGVPGVPGVPGLNGRDGAKGDRGSVGAPGKMGPKGPAGTKGEHGAKGEQGTQVLCQKNWKQCSWKNINDGRDSGLIKDCVFIKHARDTALKVEFNGDYRLGYCLGCCMRWYFTFNGVECNGPRAIDGVAHIASNHGKKDTNIHRTTQIGGYCQGIPKGTVRVGFHVGNCAGYKTANAYTGWNSVTRIMIEEVPPPQK